MIVSRTHSDQSHRLGWTSFAAVLVLALALRVAYALSTADTFSFDEDDYVDLAVNLLAGRGWTHSKGAYSTALPGQPTSFFEPLYPTLLAGIFAIVGNGQLRWARALQAVLTTGSVALLMRLAARLWNRRVALVTGLVAAVYLLWSLVAFYVLLAAIFTGGGKARLPVEPLLLVLAGGGLAALMPPPRSGAPPSR